MSRTGHSCEIRCQCAERTRKWEAEESVEHVSVLHAKHCIYTVTDCEQGGLRRGNRHMWYVRCEERRRKRVNCTRLTHEEPESAPTSYTYNRQRHRGFNRNKKKYKPAQFQQLCGQQHRRDTQSHRRQRRLFLCRLGRRLRTASLVPGV
jgi:hypothetical protein